VNADGLVERSLQLKHAPGSDQLKYVNAVKKKKTHFVEFCPEGRVYEVERPGSNQKFMFEFGCTQEGHASLDSTTS
jgi:hypothetical protein